MKTIRSNTVATLCTLFVLAGGCGGDPNFVMEHAEPCEDPPTNPEPEGPPAAEDPPCGMVWGNPVPGFHPVGGVLEVELHDDTPSGLLPIAINEHTVLKIKLRARKGPGCKAVELWYLPIDSSSTDQNLHGRLLNAYIDRGEPVAEGTLDSLDGGPGSTEIKFGRRAADRKVVVSPDDEPLFMDITLQANHEANGRRVYLQVVGLLGWRVVGEDSGPYEHHVELEQQWFIYSLSGF